MTAIRSRGKTERRFDPQRLYGSSSEQARLRPCHSDRYRWTAVTRGGPRCIGADSVTPDRPMIILGRDQTTELRLLVTAPSDDNLEKSSPVKFRVTDIGLGEAASATDNFVTP